MMFKFYYLSVVSTLLMILISILGSFLNEGLYKIYYLPLGIVGIGLVINRQITFTQKRRVIFHSIRSLINKNKNLLK